MTGRSRNNHYTPKGYMKPWCATGIDRVSEGKVYSYIRDDRGQLRHRWSAPKSICFGRDLYTQWSTYADDDSVGCTDESDVGLSDLIERDFFGPIDREGIGEIQKILDGRFDESTGRSALVRFVNSLMQRGPQIIEMMRQEAPFHMNGVMDHLYRTSDRRGRAYLDTLNFAAFAANGITDHIRRATIDPERIGNLNALNWHVVPDPYGDLITSDCPVLINLGHWSPGIAVNMVSLSLSPNLLLIGSADASIDDWRVSAACHSLGLLENGSRVIIAKAPLNDREDFKLLTAVETRFTMKLNELRWKLPNRSAE